VTFDAPTCVEDKNHQTFTFRIEVGMMSFRGLKSPTFSRVQNHPPLRRGFS
jgi:hypothetical protein